MPKIVLKNEHFCRVWALHQKENTSLSLCLNEYDCFDACDWLFLYEFCIPLLSLVTRAVCHRTLN